MSGIFRSSKKERSAFLLITVPSIISPFNSGRFSFKIEVVPLDETNSIFIVIASLSVKDFSLDLKYIVTLHKTHF